jgi:2-keto-4-pentenoate hydratase/2-oxohepta-3-ene-1,7-dioic acid hydratase in catechol pathway
MKLARYINKNEESYSLLKQEAVISLPQLAASLQATLPVTMEEFVVSGQIVHVTVESLLAIADEELIEKLSVPLSQVQLLAPIKSPPNILCLGWNYVDHAAETKTAPPEEAVIFMKPHTAIIGPDEKIVKRRL